MAITVSSSGIRSSSVKSSSSYPIEVLRSSPYFSAISSISLRITPSKSFSSARIALNSAIFCINSACSCSIFSRSKPVNARRRISIIACACTSSRPKRSIRRSFASAPFFELRIILITSSILSKAISNPLKIWARSSALFKSYRVRRVTTSS